MKIEWLASPTRPQRLPAAWLIDLGEARLRQAALALPPTSDDLARAASRPAAERENVLVRRGLVRLCAAAALGAPPADIAIGWTAKGGPLLAPPFGDHRLSWAQRGDRFACALARQPVGVDIEIADGGEIPWNTLHPREIELLRAAEPGERGALFIRIWAAKEAYAKALGEGLRRELSEFAVHLEGERGFIEDSAARHQLARIAFAPLRRGEGVVGVALLGKD